MQNNRAAFVRPFCQGRGLEIGALHFPIRLPEGSRVRYLDRMPNEELRRQYPELGDSPLVDLDILDDGETLATLPDGSEDFILAAQFIEHCENPIRALINMLRVVRLDGFVILTVPDKRRTFDADRPITSNDHLLEECRNGPGANTFLHYREFVALAQKSASEPEEIDAQARDLMSRRYSIHFHVWDSDAFIRFLLFTKDHFRLPMEIFSAHRNGNEMMFALRKSAS